MAFKHESIKGKETDAHHVVYGSHTKAAGGHPGFKAVQSKVEGEGYSPAVAGAIVANAARKASPAAKKANPNLKKVKG